jgi:hypothetical protein
MYKWDALLRPIRLCPSSSLTMFQHRRTPTVALRFTFPNFSSCNLKTYTVTNADTCGRVWLREHALPSRTDMHHWVASWLSGKSTDLYSGGTRFESRPGHPKFFQVILTPLQQMGQHQAMTEFFHIISNRVPYNPNRCTLCSLSYW